MNRRFIGREIDAIDFVARDVTVEPLDSGTHLTENADGLLGHFPELRLGETSSSRNFAFDDELGHRYRVVNRC